MAAAAGRVYHQLKPSTRWIHEDASDTLVLDLPGFLKKNMRVQVTSRENLRVSGERQLQGNKWGCFLEEFPIAESYDMNKITAKFDNNQLYIRLPKEITSVPPQNETAEKPAEHAKPKLKNELETGKDDEQKTNQEDTASNARQDNTARKSGSEETRHENESGKYRLEKYKQAASCIVPQLRRPKVVIIAVIVCSLMILGFYIRNSYRFLEACKD